MLLWIRPDAARFLKSGTDPADVFPALAMKRQREEDAEQRRIAADISDARAQVESFRRQLGAIKQEIARRRAAATSSFKYSANQPRIPAGRTGGGRWTDRSSGGGSGGGIFGGGDGEGGDAGSDLSAYAPMGDIDFGDLTGLGEFDGLFGIAPGENDSGDFTQLAGDVSDGSSQGAPSNEPPEISKQKPNSSMERSNILRVLGSWLGRSGLSLGAAISGGIINNVEWVIEKQHEIDAARDEPKTLDELQSFVGQKRPGYDDHHIVERTWAEYFGFVRSQIDDPSNMASIPRLKHYQITGWYSKPNPDYEGLSPREYLADKSWDERRRVGLDALRQFEILKP